MSSLKFLILFALVLFAKSNDEPETRLETYLDLVDRPSLDSLAVLAETLVRKLSKQEFLIGGIHDSLRFMKDNQVKEYILDQVREHPEIRDGLTERGKTLNTIQQSVEKLRTQIESYPRQVLDTLALSSEEYYRKENGMEFILGGIHDTLRFMSDKEVVDYILEKVNQYPALAPVLIQQAEKYNARQILGGLEDYIRNFNIEELRLMTVASERYHRERQGIQVLGGVEDYVRNMTRDEMITFILGYCNQYPELRRSGLLESLAFEKKLINADILDGLSRDSLESLAVQLEQHARDLKGQGMLIGGLHDKLRFMKDLEVKDYILKMGEKYPEYFQQIYDLALENKRFIPNLGGLEDYIRNLDRRSLILFALASEQYVREKKGEILIGGLHDYVNSLNNSELISYIMKQASLYPELREHGFLDRLTRKEE